jgi:arylsulfatase A-like enzyme
MPLPAVLGRVRRKLGRRAGRLRWKVAHARGRVRTGPGGAGVAGTSNALPPLVFVVVIDGLRPDSIDANDTPNLERLRREGVSFANAHSVFPTATRVNAAAIATGTYPGTNGIMHNTVFLPAVDPGASLNTGRADTLLRAQQALGGRLVLAESLGEILAARGMKLAAVSSASTGSALLLNPAAPEGVGVLVNGALDPGVRVAYPDEVNREVLARFGPAPAKAGRSRSRQGLVEWTQRVLLEYVVPELAPDVVIDWFTEPDHVQHAYGAGSPQAREALRLVDRHVGSIVDVLERLGLTSRTNLFVLSDHGVTRHTEAVDVGRALVDAGLKEGPGSDDVVVAGGGPSAQVHVKGHDPGRIRRIVEFLQMQPWTGVLFTPSDPATTADTQDPGTDGEAGTQGWVPGTFSLDLAHLRNPERSCDVLLTLAWTSEPNEFGVPGTERTTITEGGRETHTGHGGLSPWAVRTVFFGSGPDLRERTVVDRPAGQVDLVPTILRIKDIDHAGTLDGRMLVEALRGEPEDPGPAEETCTRTLTTESADGGYRASLQISSVNGRHYLDEGRRIT